MTENKAVTALNNDDTLNQRIIEALGDNARSDLVRHVRLLCRDLILETQDACRQEVQSALSGIAAITARNQA